MREAAFLRDRNKVAELMNLHRWILRCERRFVEVLAFFTGLSASGASSIQTRRSGLFPAARESRESRRHSRSR
jgi:hypothetical protein